MSESNQYLPITTGRLATHFCVRERQALIEKLERYSPRDDDWSTFSQSELEIGMGDGAAMLARAVDFPERLFIGCDIYLNGLRALYKALAGRPEIRNVRIINADIRRVAVKMPAAVFDRILLPYPDPWPKRRHHKRRIFQTEFLSSVCRLLRPDADFWLATDIRDYLDHVLKVANNHGGLRLITSISSCSNPPSWWVKTAFERRAEIEGRKSFYVQFKLKQG